VKTKTILTTLTCFSPVLGFKFQVT